MQGPVRRARLPLLLRRWVCVTVDEFPAAFLGAAEYFGHPQSHGHERITPPHPYLGNLEPCPEGQVAARSRLEHLEVSRSTRLKRRRVVFVPRANLSSAEDEWAPRMEECRCTVARDDGVERGRIPANVRRSGFLSVFHESGEVRRLRRATSSRTHGYPPCRALLPGRWSYVVRFTPQRQGTEG